MAAALKKPGMARAGLGLVLGGAFGLGWWCCCGRYAGLPTFQTEQTATPGHRSAIFAPIGFLAGLGAFDYWFRWAIGGPTYPAELEHADHGAYSWQDYFKFNTDHKVIGIQYICTTFIFFFIGGALAMVMRAELAQPGTQIVEPGDLQRAVLHARRDHDLRLRDPRVRRDRQLRAAADDRGAGHGVPPSERPQLLDAPLRRAHVRRSSCSPVAPSTPAGPATRRYPRGRRWASRSSTWASSSPALPRLRPRSTSWSRSSPCARRG